MGERNVEKLIRRYVDKRDDKLVDVVKRCIRRGYDYEKMKDRVSEHLRDSLSRKKLVDALSEAFPQFARRRKHKVSELLFFGLLSCIFIFFSYFIFLTFFLFFSS